MSSAMIRKFPFSCFRAPQHWPLALLLFPLYILCLLPFRMFRALGYVFAWLFKLSGKIRHVTKVNIRLCFPESDNDQQHAVANASIKELGLSIAETLYLWFTDGNRLLKQRISKIEGEEYWRNAVAQNRGIIVLSCHSGSLDMNVALLYQLLTQNANSKENEGLKRKEFAFTYRQPSNNFADRFLVWARAAFADFFFPVSNLLGISRVLKKGGIVWYAPDIETSKKGRVFVKFMGVDAATPSAIGKLAQSSGALVLPYRHKREAKGYYSLKFYPPLEAFPEGDEKKDTQTVNDAIEQIVREEPAAYWWSIKRFRYRPDGGPSVYTPSVSKKVN